MKDQESSFPQDEAGNDLPLAEAIDALLQAEIQALKQAEIAGTQLCQILERQAAKVRLLKAQLKKRRKMPISMEIASGEIDVWSSVSSAIWSLQQIVESERISLEDRQEQIQKALMAFEYLQEEMNNF